jgi:hypothetical protein
MRTLIRYRTTDSRYSRFVIVPTIFVSDMLHWLSDDECAEIERTEQTDELCSVPTRYPQYKACVDFIRASNLLSNVFEVVDDETVLDMLLNRE